MKLLRFFKNFYGVYALFILCAVVFVAPFLGFQFKRNYAIGNTLLFAIGVVLAIIVFVFLVKQKKDNTKFWNFIHSKYGFYWIFAVGLVLMIIVQVALINGAWFIAGWDTRNVIFPDMQMESDYMSMYPNQVFLAGVFRSIYLFLTENFNYSFDQYYYVLVWLSATAVTISVVLSTFIAKKIGGNFTGVLAFVLGFFFLGISHWILIPYSDTFALLCVTLCLFVYCYIDKNPVKWLLIFFISIIGFFIKPTVIFVLLSVVFVQICSSWKKIIPFFKNFNTKKFVVAFCSVLLSITGCFFAYGIADRVSNYGVEINEQDSFTFTHFLMMGVNMENKGAWNIDDVNLSRSYGTVEDREAANIKQWSERLNKYGFGGISWILFNKTLTNYSDGSFAWEAETPWIVENKAYNPIVWAIYGIDSADKHNDNNIFSAYVRQVMWLLILLGCAATLFRRKLDKVEYAIVCSILLISAFLTLFEPDPRYLILYLSGFCLLSVRGWQAIGNKTYNKFADKLSNINFWGNNEKK